MSARALNDLISLFFPFLVYIFAKKLFKKNVIALIASLLTASSLGLHIIARQAHEGYLASFLIIASSIFYIKFIEKFDINNAIYFLLSLTLSLFTYQSSRIFVVFFIIYSTIYLFFVSKSKRKSLSLFTLIVLFLLIIFSVKDLNSSSTRIKSLFIFSNPGLHVKTNELRIEGASIFLYNKLTVGLRELLFNHLEYFSPQFLAKSGDENTRFGFGEMSPITPIEYIFIFIGIYYLFKNNEKWKNFILFLFVFSPLSASLTWTGLSLTRSLFMLIPAMLISSYGFYYYIKKVNLNKKIVTTFIIIIEILFLFYSWNFYINHYPKRTSVMYSMQCGYKELAQYVKNNYDKFDKFYISPELGQPYIFLLFYNKYSPSDYQKQAILGNPDKYGFGQVDKFDKFIFSIADAKEKNNISIIAFPHDFENISLSETSKLKKIKVRDFEVFWILEKLN